MIKKDIFLLLTQIFLLLSYAQEKTNLAGFIYDSNTHEPLIGAMVYIKALNIGVSSNSSGYFNLSGVNKGLQSVTISLVGYETQVINMESGEKNKIIRVNLKEKPATGKEVVATAERSEEKEKLFARKISSLVISNQQLRDMPQLVENDLLRTLQNYPGVTTISDYSSELYVRGGQSDQNLFLVDGTEVYNPTHLFGLLSTFNTDAIKQVNFSKGGFGAEYGGRLSSVVDVVNIDGNRNAFKCNVDWNLLSIKATAQAPISDIGSVSGSFRRTYIDQFIGEKNHDPHYFFYDANLKSTVDLSEKNKLTLSLFSSSDKLFNPLDQDNNQLKYDWNNITASLNWQSVLSDNIFTNAWVTYSKYKSDYSYNENGINEINNISDLTLKLNNELFYSNELKFKGGIEYKHLNLELHQKFPLNQNDVLNDANSIALYASANWEPNPLWEVEFGIRGTYFTSDKNLYNIEPRLAVKYRLSDVSGIKYAFGVYDQYLHRINRGFIMGLYTIADKNIGSSCAIHNILGYNYSVSENTSIETEVYHKKFNNIYSLDQLFLVDASEGFYDVITKPPKFNPIGIDFLKGKGSSYGLEILLKKSEGVFTGYIGYSLSRTEYKFSSINQGDFFLPRQHRTHSLNAAINADAFGLFRKRENENQSRLLLGMNFSFSSGQPFTMPSSGYNIKDPVNRYSDSLFVYPTKVNNGTLPYYMRMDLSLRYELYYTKWKMTPYLQVFNIGNRKNIWAVQYEDTKDKEGISVGAKSIGMIPIIPSIGLIIEF
jgi:hypothetical protein